MASDEACATCYKCVRDATSINLLGLFVDFLGLLKYIQKSFD